MPPLPNARIALTAAIFVITAACGSPSTSEGEIDVKADATYSPIPTAMPTAEPDATATPLTSTPKPTPMQEFARYEKTQDRLTAVLEIPNGPNRAGQTLDIKVSSTSDHWETTTLNLEEFGDGEGYGRVGVNPYCPEGWRASYEGSANNHGWDHVYKKPGTYTVVASAYKHKGCDTDQTEFYVVVRGEITII